jgi:hypothetical protein
MNREKLALEVLKTQLLWMNAYGGNSKGAKIQIAHIEKVIAALTAEQPQKVDGERAVDVWNRDFANRKDVAEGLKKEALFFEIFKPAWELARRLAEQTPEPQTTFTREESQVIEKRINDALDEKQPWGLRTEPSHGSKEERAVVSREAIGGVVDYFGGPIYGNKAKMIDAMYALQLAPQPTAEIEEMSIRALWENGVEHGYNHSLRASVPRDKERDDKAFAVALDKLNEAKHGQ